MAWSVLIGFCMALGLSSEVRANVEKKKDSVQIKEVKSAELKEKVGKKSVQVDKKKLEKDHVDQALLFSFPW